MQDKAKVNCEQSIVNGEYEKNRGYQLFCLRYHSLAICKAHNRFGDAEATVVQKPYQTSYPENGLFSFSGVLFWYFFAQTKKNIIKFISLSPYIHKHLRWFSLRVPGILC
jgi:hypothetical protein